MHEYNESVIEAGLALEDDGFATSDEDPDDVAEVFQKARQLRASDASITEAQAVTKVLDAEPLLYAKYIRLRG